MRANGVNTRQLNRDVPAAERRGLTISGFWQGISGLGAAVVALTAAAAVAQHRVPLVVDHHGDCPTPAMPKESGPGTWGGDVGTVGTRGAPRIG